MTRFFRTHDGMILCLTHLREAFVEMVPPYRKRPRDEAGDVEEVKPPRWDATKPVPEPDWGILGEPRCGMCGQSPAPGRTCGSCGTPLHELWPAIYCSTECALRDL